LQKNATGYQSIKEIIKTYKLIKQSFAIAKSGNPYDASFVSVLRVK